MGFLRKNFHLITGIGLLTLASGSALALYLDVPAALKNRSAAQAAQQTYTCPMHSEVAQHGPGNCPKCGMALVLGAKKDSCAQNPVAASDKPSGSCGKEESGCCPKKAAAEVKVLPAGHPPVSGWVVATNQAAAITQ